MTLLAPTTRVIAHEITEYATMREYGVVGMLVILFLPTALMFDLVWTVLILPGYGVLSGIGWLISKVLL